MTAESVTVPPEHGIGFARHNSKWLAFRLCAGATDYGPLKVKHLGKFDTLAEAVEVAAKECQDNYLSPLYAPE